jgi:hypothetical protein
MAKELFVPKKFRTESLARIAQVNEIVVEYQAMGFAMTLRQVYYQMVSRGLIENKKTEYDNLGSLISTARLAGLLDWSAIEDRTRRVNYHSSWDDPEEILRGAAEGYRENPWNDQESYIEVWIEKEALAGVITPVCDRWRVPYFSCRGYVSQSAQYAAGKRLAYQRDTLGKTPLIIHLGDHDPSGIDMTRDNDTRLEMFARMGIPVERVALNMNQIEEYDPPPNPVKELDSRSGPYRERFGDESWELDALEPRVIDQIIEETISDRVDGTVWAESLEREELERAKLTTLVEGWADVEEILGDMEFVLGARTDKDFIETANEHRSIVEAALRDPELTAKIFANINTVRHRMEF